MDEIIKEAFSNVEREKLIQFSEDKVMFEAVKKYLLVYKYGQGVGEPNKSIKGNVNYALQMAFNAITPPNMGGVDRTNEELGANARALAYAVQFIESGFMEIADLKGPEKVKSDETNPAL
jgi:hypothetical protein